MDHTSSLRSLIDLTHPSCCHQVASQARRLSLNVQLKHVNSKLLPSTRPRKRKILRSKRIFVKSLQRKQVDHEVFEAIVEDLEAGTWFTPWALVTSGVTVHLSVELRHVHIHARLLYWTDFLHCGDRCEPHHVKSTAGCNQIQASVGCQYQPCEWPSSTQET